MDAIIVSDLRKSYVKGRRRRDDDAPARVDAVRGIDLRVATGEIVALLGPNGAGKTTTVEILEGVRRRDAGEVAVLDADPAGGDARWKSRIGIVWQSSTAFDDMTVREVVAHFAGFYPSPRSIADTIERVGLAPKADERAGRLSGGQRRRLDVALGVIGRPELLFLDEPTTGFDPEARHQFWELIAALRNEGTTIVLTTHYLDEAEALADRVAVIVAGQIVAEGSPDTLGGRSRADVVVGWTEVDGTSHEVATPTPTATIAELAARLGGEIPGLVVHRPTLEDTYLRLIGATPTGDYEEHTNR